MHDLTYANRILDSLKKEVGKRENNTPVTIDVYLSPLSHVTPQRLKDVFSLLSEEAGFVNTTMNVNIAEFCIRCKKCGKSWKSAQPTFECPECDSADFELEKWEEFYIDSIRIEK